MRDGKVIARGWTAENGRPHAEARALGEAGARAQGATLYVSLEPCAHASERGPACADLVAQSGVSRVVIGMEDPDPRTSGGGIARIRDAGITVDLIPLPTITAGLCGFVSVQRAGRPFVTLKLATSLDGQIALADGNSRWITGDAARAHVHAQRSRHDAILVGGGTWRNDLPQLNVRLPGLENRSPRRVVLTRGVAPDGVKVINAPDQIAHLNGVLTLYCEGGAQTAAAFLERDMVDRLDIYRAPVLIGAGHSALGDIGLDCLADAHGRWSLTESCQLGSDRYESYARTREEI